MPRRPGARRRRGACGSTRRSPPIPSSTATRTFCAIAETHPGTGASGRTACADARSAPSRAHGEAPRGRVRRHAYLQRRAAEQLAALPPLRLGYVYDLAVGTAGDGYDAWSLGRGIALGMKAWRAARPAQPARPGLGPAAARPGRLPARAATPVAAMLPREHGARRGSARRPRDGRSSACSGSRPAGAPSEGAYVRYPADDLLGVLALESRRGALPRDRRGPRHGRGRRAARRSPRATCCPTGSPGSRTRPPQPYPRLAMAAVTTHDLPTIDGFFGGADLAHLRAIGLPTTRAGGRAERQAHERACSAAASPTRASCRRTKAIRPMLALRAARVPRAVALHARRRVASTTSPARRCAPTSPAPSTRTRTGGCRCRSRWTTCSPIRGCWRWPTCSAPFARQHPARAGRRLGR